MKQYDLMGDMGVGSLDVPQYSIEIEGQGDAKNLIQSLRELVHQMEIDEDLAGTIALQRENDEVYHDDGYITVIIKEI